MTKIQYTIGLIYFVLISDLTLIASEFEIFFLQSKFFDIVLHNLTQPDT